jgi:aspartate/tyrosine/aromatic aminotransferase
LRRTDGQGNFLGYSGAKLPKNFFDPIEKELETGRKINLCSPLATAYYKIHENREYDISDLRALKPNLNEADLDSLKIILEQETENNEQAIQEKLIQLWNNISPMLGLTKDKAVIQKAILSDKEVQARQGDSRIPKYAEQISAFILENPNLTFEEFSKTSLDILQPREAFKEKLKTLEK